MTKGGSGKSKTLGRLIFGEKRKPHESPSRRRSSTRNSGTRGGGGTEPILSTTVATATVVNNNPINISDWAVWRMQLNEQMSAAMSNQQFDFKKIRQFLHSNSFYQQHSRSSSKDRFNTVRLLFSIPRAIIRPEFLDGLRGVYTKNHHNEEIETIVYEDKKVRSNSDDRTTTSVNSMSGAQPIVIEKTINQVLPKALTGNTSAFIRINEQMIATNGIQPRRSIRRSFIASDRIHSTLQKAVKDGNVLEKIKAFEMQAAAAQAIAIGKLGGINHRIPPIKSAYQTAPHYRSSPAIIHPMQQTISPIPVPIQKDSTIRSNRDQYPHQVQQHLEDVQAPTTGHKSRKGPHVLEPAHGDIILKRRTSSQKTANEEDCSVTGISSMAVTTSQSHHRNPHPHQRTSVARSRHHHEAAYEKRAPSKNEHTSHKHQQNSKLAATATSSKPSSRRHWLKGRKEVSSDTINHENKLQEHQKLSTTKSCKTKTNKKKNVEQEKIEPKKAMSLMDKEQLLSDNNRVYGVPNPNVNEQPITESSPTKIEENYQIKMSRDLPNTTNSLIPIRKESTSHIKECDTVISMTIQRRPRKNSYQQKVTSSDGDILGKANHDHRLPRPTDDYPHHPELIDKDDGDDHDDDKRDDDDVFIEESPSKHAASVIRHQSFVNLSQKETRRFQQQSATGIRRHASHYSSNEFTLDRRYQQEKENPPVINTNTIKVKSPPITIITRKNKINHDKPIVYEGPGAEQAQASVYNSHTLKKSRPYNAVDVTGTANGGHGQSNNNNNNKQRSKQILHAIMNSMNNNQEQTTIGPSTAVASEANDEFFENGPLTNPEETFTNITTLA